MRDYKNILFDLCPDLLFKWSQKVDWPVLNIKIASAEKNQ